MTSTLKLFPPVSRVFRPNPVLSTSTRGIRMFKPTEPHFNISQPDAYRLPILPKVPAEHSVAGFKPPKGQKELYRYMGEENVHTELILKQYGIVAVAGGGIKLKHYDTLKNKINRYLEEDKSFAIMRVDPPYKPVTSKGGKRMGGGKGSIKTYVTPVRAGRVIFEIGGKVDWDEVQPWLSRMAKLLPFEAIAVNQDILNRLNAEEDRLQRANLNGMTLEWFIRNNILDCQQMLNAYDIKWMGKFTYQDKHNNMKWNLAMPHTYKRK